MTEQETPTIEAPKPHLYADIMDDLYRYYKQWGPDRLPNVIIVHPAMKQALMHEIHPGMIRLERWTNGRRTWPVTVIATESGDKWLLEDRNIPKGAWVFQYQDAITYKWDRER